MEEQQELIMNVVGKEAKEHRIDITAVDHHISDRVKKWIESVRKENERSSPTPSWPSIPKVPHLLRGTNDFEKFYEPRLVSIGPYHHGKPHLHSVEKIKALYATEFLDASGQSMEDVYKKIQRNIGAVRKCYNRRPTNKYDEQVL